jgi:ribose transport system substrate-binding protein
MLNLRRIMLAVLVLLVWSGVPGGEAMAASPGSQAPAVGLVMKTLTNPFFAEMEKGARRAEKEFGVRLQVKTGAKETSIDQQIAIVEEMIREKVAAIVIAPGSSTELVPVLKKAQDAGIPIVNIDNRLDPGLSKRMGLRDVPFVSGDNVQGAYLSAAHIARMAVGPAKAALLEGIRSAANAEQRKQGALKAFAGQKQVTVVAMETANWKIDEANAVTANLFKEQPDISLLFCANDMMALGAIEYLRTAGKSHVLVAGYDALDEALRAVREGKLQATIDQQAAQQGFIGVRYAVDLLKGRRPPLETFVEVKLITRATLP